jgi:hypothetical protein
MRITITVPKSELDKVASQFNWNNMQWGSLQFHFTDGTYIWGVLLPNGQTWSKDFLDTPLTFETEKDIIGISIGVGGIKENQNISFQAGVNQPFGFQNDASYTVRLVPYELYGSIRYNTDVEILSTEEKSSKWMFAIPAALAVGIIAVNIAVSRK